MGLILEVCVDSLAGLAAAVAGGADRVELCSALELGGLTPSAGVMAAAAGCGVPVLAMIRPRSGDFVWSEAEVAAMLADIAAARVAGLAGVVLGASLPDGRLDVGVLERLAAAAGRLDLTLHRCFDLVPDMDVALEEAVALGFRRVLTSGGAMTAAAGEARIGRLVERAAGRIAVMAGAGVTVETAPGLLAVGVRELHGSCAEPVAAPGKVSEMGFGPKIARRTSAARVRALKQVMEAAGGVQRHV
ncbi:copper homeostasis protein CutC [Tabrizicola aquatica]|uniref:copper homeostasis protein CutC n=1 Tax=Tabrizicola aquatica TaxID=909926 RepID=UPI000CD23663|nr:copper homeostasis protein CutC [Tabrizicola aquatica]